MSKNAALPVTPTERIEFIDALRGIAVCGILIGNMQWFSGYGMLPPSFDATMSAADQVTRFLVHLIVEGKFYSIFSFLFGFGFALQITRAAERGDTKASVFKWRLFWLLLIGALHAALLWYGDILTVYALMGFVLLLFRKRSDAALLKWAGVLMLVPVATYALLYGLFAVFVPAETVAGIDSEQAARWNATLATVGQGNYAGILRDYNLPMIAFRWIGLVMQMRLPKILAMLLLGFYAYRIGVFQNIGINRTLIRKAAVYGLLIGIVGNLAMAALAGNEAPFPPSPAALLGVAGYAIGVPALAIGITAALTLLWENAAGRRMLQIVSPVGRMALTNYLLQTLAGVSIFYGYGFGWFGQVGATSATLIALAIFAAQILISTLWLRNFAYGPLEWLWRQLTYRRRLAIRKTAAAAAA